MVYYSVCNKSMPLAYEKRKGRSNRLIYKCNTCAVHQFEPKHANIFKYDDLKEIVDNKLKVYIESLYIKQISKLSGITKHLLLSKYFIKPAFL